MSKFIEVKIKINAVVLVEVGNDETFDDAITYAADEYSNVDGYVEAQFKSEIKGLKEIESSKRHSDKSLLL